MSQQPPPPGSYGPPGHPGPTRARAGGTRRRRPSTWWFAAPLTLLAVAAVLVVTAFVTTLGPLGEQDAVVPADGSPQTVELDDDGTRLLMAAEGEQAPTCEATDARGGSVEVVRPSAGYSFGNGRDSWSGFGLVEPGGDTLELTCSSSAPGATEVRVGPAPSGEGFVGLAVMLVAGVALAFLGVVLLVLLIVLVATGAPRDIPRRGPAR